MKDVIVIGGGLAGLSSALTLARTGFSVTVIEKKAYPFHRVCGEYISNEALPYLCWLGSDISSLMPARISHFMLTSPKGKYLQAKLDLGGFGLSRYTLDNYLYELALKHDIKFMLNTTVQEVMFTNDAFTVRMIGGEVLTAKVVLGCYGKRSNLDRQLKRPFFNARSPYLGVKYHIKYPNHPKNLIALHNFKDGYAGVSAVEDNKYCFCYLTSRSNFKKHGTIPKLEQEVLWQNPHLYQLFKESEFLYEQPEVINEISFATKTCIENHMLMCGDAAGMITPLCGNGMAIAIHTGKLASRHATKFLNGECSRQEMEQQYSIAWQQHFGKRLQTGRAVQQLFGSPLLSELAVGALRFAPPVVQYIMKQTHGYPF